MFEDLTKTESMPKTTVLPKIGSSSRWSWFGWYRPFRHDFRCALRSKGSWYLAAVCSTIVASVAPLASGFAGLGSGAWAAASGVGAGFQKIVSKGPEDAQLVTVLEGVESPAWFLVVPAIVWVAWVVWKEI